MPDPSNAAAAEDTSMEAVPRPAESCEGGALTAGLYLRPLAGLLLGGLAALLACGLLFWPKAYPWFAPEAAAVEGEENAGPPSGESPEEAAVRRSSDRQNIAFAMALVGALLIGLLGIGEGVASHNRVAILRLATAGTLAGALCGCIAGVIGHLVYLPYEEQFISDQILPTMLIQGVAWALVGISAGLVLGISTGSRAATIKLTVGGLLAGVLAAVCFAVLAAALVPNANTNTVVPEAAGGELVVVHLIWLGVASLLIGFILPAVGARATSTVAREGGEPAAPAGPTT